MPRMKARTARIGLTMTNCRMNCLHLCRKMLNAAVSNLKLRKAKITLLAWTADNRGAGGV